MSTIYIYFTDIGWGKKVNVSLVREPTTSFGVCIVGGKVYIHIHFKHCGRWDLLVNHIDLLYTPKTRDKRLTYRRSCRWLGYSSRISFRPVRPSCAGKSRCTINICCVLLICNNYFIMFFFADRRSNTLCQPARCAKC